MGRLLNKLKPKLAICVPTYNNPQYIEDILIDELPLYRDNNIELYILDSSEGRETENLYSKYKGQYTNIHYISFSPDIHSNRKVYQAYQMAGKEISCDYIWIRSDATRAAGELLQALPYYLGKEYDFVVTSYEGVYPKGIWETEDPQAIFDEYAWRLCLYGAAILRVDTMLDSVPWGYLEEKYLKEDTINYSHVALYFEQMLRVDNFKGLVMGLPTCLYHLTEKKKKSSWHKDIFKIWLEFWPNTIEALPSFYRNKLAVIRDFGINVHYYYMPMLRTLAKEGVLTKEIYAKYEKRIKKYANMPWENFRDAAYGFPNERDGVGQEAYYWPYEVNLFKMNCNHRYIYGCGKAAKKQAELLIKMQVEWLSFVVTTHEEAEQKKEVMGHIVKAVDDLEFTDGSGILLALNDDHQKEVISLLRSKGLLKYVYSYHGTYAHALRLVETVKAHALSKNMGEWI